jgi:hypothetical protein
MRARSDVFQAAEMTRARVARNVKNDENAAIGFMRDAVTKINQAASRRNPLSFAGHAQHRARFARAPYCRRKAGRAPTGAFTGRDWGAVDLVGPI